MLEYLLPKSAEVREVQEAFALHQAAQEFRLEVEYRQTHAEYCQWYHEMARQTQADALAMENDVNFFSWFCGRRSA